MGLWGARRRFLAAMLAGFGLSLVACTHPAAGAAGRDPVRGAAQPLPAAAAGILLRGGETAPEQALLDRGVQQLVSRCMSARQLRYYPATGPDAGEPDSSVLPEFPAYGTLAQRRAGGYGESALAASRSPGPDLGGGIAPADTEDRYLRSLPAPARTRYYTALFGPASSDQSFALAGVGLLSEGPAGGCQGLAERELDGTVARYMAAEEGPSRLRLVLTREVESSSPFTTTMRAWSRCMAGRGFRYSTPSDAWNDVAARYARQGVTSGLRHREIQVAVADWDCAAAVRLVPVTTALQERYARQLPATLRADLLGIASIDAAAVSRAVALTRGS